MTQEEKPKLNYITLIDGEGDYSPVLVLGEYGEVVFTGDNIHNPGYDLYAKGYADAKGLRVRTGCIEDKESLEAHKPILEAAGQYKEFFEYYKDY